MPSLKRQSLSVERLLLTLLIPAFSFAVCSFPVFAEASGPDYWQVRNVEKNDVLNVRSHADYRAAKIGEIAHDASCIKNMGCKGGLTLHEFTTLSESEKQKILKLRPRWCRIKYKNNTGWVAGRYLQEGVCPETAAAKVSDDTSGINPFNHSYSIEKDKVTLRNGNAREKIPGTSAVIITEIVHPPIYGNLNDDNSKEAVSVLMQHTGGTGTFYYLAAAVNGEAVIESYFLGDRISIRSLRITDKTIVVDYLDRNARQAMAVKPSVMLSKKFRLEAGKLVISQQ